MAVKDSNKRIVITLDKELIEVIRKNAIKNGRTISKEITLIVKECYEEK